MDVARYKNYRIYLRCKHIVHEIKFIVINVSKLLAGSLYMCMYLVFPSTWSGDASRDTNGNDRFCRRRAYRIYVYKPSVSIRPHAFSFSRPATAAPNIIVIGRVGGVGRKRKEEIKGKKKLNISGKKNEKEEEEHDRG